MQPVQLKMARAALDLGIDDLASKAGVSHVEVQQLETGGEAGTDAAEKVRAALESGGIEWIGEDGVRFAGATGTGALAPEDLNAYNDK